MAKVNPFRFSTKYTDNESGLINYGYSLYKPDLGRWLRPDPLSELSFVALNLPLLLKTPATWDLLRSAGEPRYGFVQNNPVNMLDYLGLAYFAKRPLHRTGIGPISADVPWIPVLSQNPVSDALNIEVAHEQLFFEDGGTPSNLGFNMTKMLKDDKHTDFIRMPGKYDDCLMREAVKIVGNPQPYMFIGNNCQDWATRVRQEYRKLKKQQQQQ